MWLYLPSTSAPGTEDSSSPSDPWHGYEPWLTLSGTPTRRPSSWNGWARRAWIKLLCGMTSPPSTVARGVAAWISSLPVSLASHSAPPANARGLTMTAGSGRPSHPSSLRFDPSSSSWRTSPSLFDTGSPTSSTTLPTSGSMRNGVCSAREPLEPLTDANAPGSWPTPTAMDVRKSGGAPTNSHGVSLTDATVRMWGTPVARDDQKSPEAHQRMKANMPGGPRTEVTSLTVQSKMWGTPRASDGGGRGSDPPRKNARAGSPTLKNQVASHHSEATPTAGLAGSPKVDLNPFFVATLMGLPADWLTPSTSAVTASCRRQLATPSGHSSSEAGGRCDDAP
jgi:hypothetical protein